MARFCEPLLHPSVKADAERHRRRVLGPAAVRRARPARIGHLELVVARLDRNRDREDVVRDFLQLVLGQHGPVAAQRCRARTSPVSNGASTFCEPRGSSVRLLRTRGGGGRGGRVVVLVENLTASAGVPKSTTPVWPDGMIQAPLPSACPPEKRAWIGGVPTTKKSAGRLEIERFRHRNGRRRRFHRGTLVEVGGATAAAAAAREQRDGEEGGRGKLQQVSERARHGHTPGHAAELDTPAGVPTRRLTTAGNDAGCASLMDSWSITSKRERSPVSSDDRCRPPPS